MQKKSARLGRMSLLRKASHGSFMPRAKAARGNGLGGAAPRPFPSPPSSTTVFAVKGALRRAKPRALDRSRAVPNLSPKQGKGRFRKTPCCPLPPPLALFSTPVFTMRQSSQHSPQTVTHVVGLKCFLCPRPDTPVLPWPPGYEALILDSLRGQGLGDAFQRLPLGAHAEDQLRNGREDHEPRRGEIAPRHIRAGAGCNQGAE